MDATSLLIVVAIVLLVMYVLNRSRAELGAPPLGDDEQLGYDGPNYTSTASIGGSGAVGSSQVYNDPNYSSAGSTGASEPPLQERSVGESTGSSNSGRTHDDPNDRSGGSIGG